MRAEMWGVRLVGVALLGGLLLGGCQERPTITVHFESSDAAAVAARTSMDAAVQQHPPPPGGPVAAAPPPASAAPPTKAPPSPPLVDKGGGVGDAGRCARDADCVMVKGDCCGCSAGGTAKVVARAQQAEAERALAARCGTTTMCVQVLSNHPSCRAVARCREGRCVAGEPGAAE